MSSMTSIKDFFYWVFITVQDNYCRVLRTGSDWKCGCLGLELRLLKLQHATRSTLVMGTLPPVLTFPSQGCLYNLAAEMLLPGGRSTSFSSHPTVLASKQLGLQERANSPVYFLNILLGFHILLQLTCMNITMPHCCIIREHGLVFCCIGVPPPLGVRTS